MKKNKINSNYLSKRNLIILILILILFLALICIYFSNEQNNKVDNNFLYSNTITKDIDYKVNLLDNNFIQKDYLEKGQTYISELVKAIDTNFKYDYRTSKKMNLKYTYNIIATIKGEYKSNSTDTANSVWEKSYTILDDKTQTLTDAAGFTINENSLIDFPFYNNEVLEFRKNLKLSINAYADVSMNVQVFSIDEQNNAVLQDNSSVSMVIPLNKQAFSITENYKKTDTINVFDENTNSNINILIYIAILLIIADIFIFIFNFNIILNKNGIKSRYKSDLNKILKTYGDVVVEIVNPVKTKLSGVIDVKNFNEMIDLEEELRMPILFYEIPGRNEGWFTIIHNEILYRFVLRENKSNKNITNLKNSNAEKDENDSTSKKRRKTN